MAKFLKILVGTVAGGLAAGAGIRIAGNGSAVQMRKLQERLEAEIDFRMAAAEAKLQAALQDRVGTLEAAVNAQSQSMQELRECSLRTEHSVQELLKSIDRLVTVRRDAEPALPVELKRRRIFG